MNGNAALCLLDERYEKMSLFAIKRTKTETKKNKDRNKSRASQKLCGHIYVTAPSLVSFWLHDLPTYLLILLTVITLILKSQTNEKYLTNQ